MPGNILSLDTQFPSVKSGTTEEKLNSIESYLYTLLESLRYTLGNLDADNFNETGLYDLAEQIQKPVYAKIRDIDNNVATLALTASSLEARVGNTETGLSQSLRIAPDGVTITNAQGSALTIDGGQVSAENLELTGRITFSDLSSESQKLISDTAETALSAQSKADSAYNLASLNQLPSYITATKITRTEIESPTISAGVINSATLNSPTINTNTLNLVANMTASDYASIKFVGAYFNDAGEQVSTADLFSIGYTAATTSSGLSYPILAISGAPGSGFMLGNANGATGIIGSRVSIEASTLAVTPGMVTNLAVNVGGAICPVFGANIT